MIEDVYAQLADYRGVLGWNAFTSGFPEVIPAIEIPLFIKEHPLPVRRPKLSEMYGISQVTNDGLRKLDSKVSVVFEGVPDALVIDLAGWLITPIRRFTDGAGDHIEWDPRDKDNNSLNWGNISYADIITMFITGQLNRSLGNYYSRKDPDYYISPYGQKYLNPLITNWDPSHAPVQKKQPFSMSLQLEK